MAKEPKQSRCALQLPPSQDLFGLVLSTFKTAYIDYQRECLPDSKEPEFIGRRLDEDVLSLHFVYVLRAGDFIKVGKAMLMLELISYRRGIHFPSRFCAVDGLMMPFRQRRRFTGYSFPMKGVVSGLKSPKEF
jgi:hypothetical protein